MSVRLRFWLFIHKLVRKVEWKLHTATYKVDGLRVWVVSHINWEDVP